MLVSESSQGTAVTMLSRGGLGTAMMQEAKGPKLVPVTAVPALLNLTCSAAAVKNE